MDSQNLQDLAALKTIHKGKGTLAIILGIVSLFVCLGPISFICGIIAIIVGVNARKKSRKTVGTGGMVLGIIGVALSLIATVGVLLVFGGVGAGVLAPQYANYVEASNTSGDMQVCDTVRTAIMVAMTDPTIVAETESEALIQTFGDGYFYYLEDILAYDCAFSEYVLECLDVSSYNELADRISTVNNADIMVAFSYTDGVSVTISGTDIMVD